MANSQLVKVAAAVEELRRRKATQKMIYYAPYPKQEEFHDLGATKRERLLMAGNQLGKTYCGAMEMAYHLTGDYPEWWFGRRFSFPIQAWACGITGTDVRDTSQTLLCGDPTVEDMFGTGAIPLKRFVGKPTLSRGVADAFDSIAVEHRTNGVKDGTSVLHFKSYEQGRKKFQGRTIHCIWLDEEPDFDVYGECLARITATKGMIYMTFTPLLGRSAVVTRYTDEKSDDRAMVTMTIDDAQHISKDERDVIVAGYAAHEREARSKGIPMLGSGRIFTATEESIIEPAFARMPRHWPMLWGLDFGVEHPFGAMLMAWDRDADVLHWLAAIRIPGALPLQHVAALKPFGLEIPVAWPNDGNVRREHGGKLETLATIYRAHGLKMLPTHAVWPDGGDSVEAGIAEMSERMASNRWKVAAHLEPWLEEYRLYHRSDGQIVKLKDDLLSASRYGMMMKKYAKVVNPDEGSRPITTMATGLDFPVI